MKGRKREKERERAGQKVINRRNKIRASRKMAAEEKKNKKENEKFAKKTLFFYCVCVSLIGDQV